MPCQTYVSCIGFADYRSQSALRTRACAVHCTPVSANCRARATAPPLLLTRPTPPHSPRPAGQSPLSYSSRLPFPTLSSPSASLHNSPGRSALPSPPSRPVNPRRRLTVTTPLDRDDLPLLNTAQAQAAEGPPHSASEQGLGLILTPSPAPHADTGALAQIPVSPACPEGISADDLFGSALLSTKRKANDDLDKFDEVCAELGFRGCVQHARYTDELADLEGGDWQMVRFDPSTMTDFRWSGCRAR